MLAEDSECYNKEHLYYFHHVLGLMTVIILKQYSRELQ